MSFFRMFLVLMTLLLASSALTACNTIGGAGEDIKAGGDAISDSADDVKDKM